MARLRTDFWVQAYLLRLHQSVISAYVRQHGDDSAGAILIKLVTLDGRAALWMRQYDFDTDTQKWVETLRDSESEIETYVRREMERDRDLWVIEVEDAKGRHLLDQEGF